MKKLFKTQKLSSNLTSDPDLYWSDTYAVFNMNDSFDGYSGILDTPPTIIKQSADIDFITIDSVRMVSLSPTKAAILSIPNCVFSGDFTLEGCLYLKNIDNPVDSSYYLMSMTGIILVARPLKPNTDSISTSNGNIGFDSNPDWPFQKLVYFAFVRKNNYLKVFQYYSGTVKTSNIITYTPSFYGRAIGLGGDRAFNTNLQCPSAFGPIRLTRRARYWENYTPHIGLFPNHG